MRNLEVPKSELTAKAKTLNQESIWDYELHRFAGW